jgi:hypothetical protein
MNWKFEWNLVTWDKELPMKNAFILIIFFCVTQIRSQTLQGADLNDIGKIKSDGTVLDESNKLMGRFKPDGMVTNKSSVIIGYIKSDGSIQNESKTVVGYVLNDGTIQDAEKKTIGYIKDGVVSNHNNETIGYAKKIPVKWAAAYFFFLF